MTDRKVWMVTGSSRGLGRAIVEGLLERGELVVATARPKPRELPVTIQTFRSVMSFLL